ncbi:MAG TPA: MlaE family lipid ABC transporter permease subunit [Gammaproteobacteria bacterium]|nr:MlaE family lipid ABC transporter permease subunit [Gammaproteobacteria bacterium]
MEKAANIYLKDRELLCEGTWTVSNIPILKKAFLKIALPKGGDITFDGGKITAMDTAGAWLLNQWSHQLSAKKITAQWVHFPEHTEELFRLIQKNPFKSEELPRPERLDWLAALGKITIEQARELYLYLNFIGKLSIELLRIIQRPGHIRWKAICSSIYRTGYQALPIIGLLSFMIGVVLTYQMGVQLRNYGANIFIVDLLGLAVLREFGPLLTAIMVAGRTGSSFTAELGLMKANQEIDALDTLGVTPGELLLIPKIIGLFIALPLLTIWADIFGILGGMVMSNNMLHISWYDFLNRFQHQIPVKALLLGLFKAPVFALLISSIGCFQGMSVKDTADSIGKNTTKSVVYAIFFIMMADALFSIIFSKLKL